MPRTPDRFPGERQDEGIILSDNILGDPTTVGGLRFILDRFRFRDVLGVYTGRPIYVTTVAPTAAEDSDSGYEIGMLWLDTVTSVTYICLDDTTATAVWVAFTIPPATQVGDHLVSQDGITFDVVQPVVSPEDGWLANADGNLLVEGLGP